jgi:hypothetical protein
METALSAAGAAPAGPSVMPDDYLLLASAVRQAAPAAPPPEPPRPAPAASPAAAPTDFPLLNAALGRRGRS